MSYPDLIAYINYCLYLYYQSLACIHDYDYTLTWSDRANAPQRIANRYACGANTYVIGRHS